MANKDKNKENKLTREAKINIVVNVGVALVAVAAFILSIYTYNADKFNSSESVRPDIKIWNQTFIVETNSKIELAYSNIGHGMAQDISFSISVDEKNRVLQECKSILDQVVKEKPIGGPVGNSYLYSYYFDGINNGKINIISDDENNIEEVINDKESFHFWIKGETFESANYDINEDNYSIDNTNMYRTNVVFESPLIQKEKESYFYLPEDLSFVICNCLRLQKNQKIENIPISVYIDISYSDYLGKMYEKTIELVFYLDENEMASENRNECYICVSTK